MQTDILSAALMKNIAQLSIIRNGLTYLSGGMLGGLVPFLMLPVLTRYLSPSDFGIVATFQSILTLSFAFIGLNTTGAIVRNYTELSKDEFAVYIFNCIIILLISVGIVLSILLLFKGYAVSISQTPIQWLLLVPVASCAFFLFSIALSVFRVLGKALQFSIANITNTLFNLIVSVVLVVWLSMDWRGRVIGISSSHIIFGVLALFFLIKTGYISPRFDKVYFRDALLFGSPLILHKLAGWITTMLNRPLLNEFVGLEATGLFFIGCTIASIVAILEGAFEQAWTPWLYSRLNENTQEVKRKIVKITYVYYIALLVLVFMLSFLSPYVLPVFLGKQYVNVSNYVFFPALAYAFNGMRKMVFGYILYEKKTYLIAYSTVVTSGIGIILNVYLIRHYGVNGASYAMSTTFIIGFILTWYMAQKTFPMPWLLLGRTGG